MVVKLKAVDGTEVAFDDSKPPMQGGMKDVYFAPDKSYVVAFFREKQDADTRLRLELLTGKYRDAIFNQAGGEYWKNVFCWPTKMLEYNGRIGLVAPTYPQYFFFKYGSYNNSIFQIKGSDKQGDWFTNPWHRFCNLDPRERGDWRKFLRICINISRGVRRLHAAGLAHSDLSYKNVLVDPIGEGTDPSQGGNACIIDIDGLVVPGKFPPGVQGTPGFIAPEVVKTGKLPLRDPKKSLPRRETDQHALAVLIYLYLLNRHPLEGKKINDLNDEIRDNELSWGEKALFIENPQDTSNRYDRKWVQNNSPSSRLKYLFPYQDLDALPYNILGPYLSPLVLKAFVDGLHNPGARPTADDWEHALLWTWDLLQPCINPSCPQKWYPFANTSKPICPFCKTAFKGKLPVINFYSKRPDKTFKIDPDKLMVYSQQVLFPWHVFKNISPSEKLSPDQKKSVGRFVFFQNDWVLENTGMPSLEDITDKTRPNPIGIGKIVKLANGTILKLSSEEGGRLAQVQLVDA